MCTIQQLIYFPHFAACPMIVPSAVLKASKYIPDLIKQTSKVGELRGAIQDGLMSEKDVYCEVRGPTTILQCALTSKVDLIIFLTLFCT
jgi:hypothetical protein